MAETKKEMLLCRLLPIMLRGSMSVIDLINLSFAFDRLIKSANLKEDFVPEEDLFEYLSLQNKKDYSTEAERVRVLKILRYATLIAAHHQTSKKQEFVAKINTYQLSAEEVDYVKIITRNASLKDSDLIVVDSAVDDDNSMQSFSDLRVFK